MCDCFARVFGVSWSPAASSVAEGHVPESHVSRARQAPPAESKRNDQPAQSQTSAGSHPPLPPEEAGDPDRAAQKEKLHEELKRVLQKKGARRASSEETEEEPQAPGGMEAQLRKMEKTIETSELLEIIVETEAEAGVSGMSVAGGGKQGLFVKDVLKGSPAARALSLREGDQLLSARVYFDNMKYEDALQILKSAEPYKVSFCLKRTVPSTDVARSPGAPTFEVRGPKAKMAKLNIQSLTSLKKKKPKKIGKGLARALREAEARGGQEPAGGKLEVAPVDVEFSLPKFSKLRKARSAGEVAAAQPSPDLSPLLSSLETKRRRLKLPRLKVKEALAARAAGAAGRLDGAPPKAAPEQKAAAREGAGVKASRFTLPFSRGKKPKEEAAGFQAPQVELDFSLPKAEPPEGGADRKGLAAQVPSFGLPKVEVVLPQGSPEAPEEASPAGLRLPTAEVAAPKVDVALSLPRLEGATPEAALRGQGFQIKVPKVGVSADDVVLGKGRGKAEGREEKVAMPALDVGLPSADIEFSWPGGKAGVEAPKPKVEIPEVSLKVPTLSLPKLGSKPPKAAEEESRVPQVELSLGRLESPKPKAKSQAPGFGVSLAERKAESREAAAGPIESKMKSLGLKVPSLDISAPKVGDMPLPKALAGLAAPGPEAEAEEAVEGPRFKLQMPQVSLPTCSMPAKATASPPQVPEKPEGKASGKVGVPALDLSLEVQLPKGHVPKPEWDLCVDRPQLEVALPAPRLSFPSAAVPALELDLPRAGIELGLPRADGESPGSDRPPWDHEVRLKLPTLETLSRDLGVELSVPTCREEPGVEAAEGPGLGGVVAKIPKVGLALGQVEATAAGLGHKGAVESGGPAKRGEVKLPSVELSAPQGTTEKGRSPETEAKLKSPKFALPKFSLPGPKAWKVSTELFGAQGEGPEAADRGAKLKMPKFGLSFPKSRGGAEAEGPKPGPGGGRRSPDKERAESGMKLPSVALPRVDLEVPIGLPTGKAESSDEEGPAALPELGIELPDIRRKMPKFSLPRFGGRGKESDVELETGEALAGERGAKAEKEAQAKASKFKVALFGMAGRDLEGVGPPGESPQEKPRGPLLKMPKLRLPSPKAELGQGHVPQVELPKISLPEAKAEEAPLMGSESPSLRVRVPSLEITVPGAATKAEPTPGRAERKIPQAPSLGVSAPQVELDLRLPTVGAEAPMPQGVPGTEAKVKLPQVELPTLGRGEAADGQLPGRGEERGAAEAVKIRVPKVGLSWSSAPLPDGEGGGPEGRLQLPSVELPTFSTPKVRAPEREGSLERGQRLPAVKLSSPAIGLPQFRGPSLGGDAEREAGLPQLELKVPKLGGSAERLGTGAGAEEGRGPCPSGGFGLCRAEGEAGAAEEVAVLGPDSKFKLKIPALSIAKAGAEPRADTQPLCPSPKGEEASFRMPPLTLPEVGFSVEREGKREAKVEAGKLASAEGLEAEGPEARLKMPRIKIPALGVSVPKGGREAATPQDPEGKKAAFWVPGLELAAPTLKGHAEYEVEGAQLQAGGSGELAVAGRSLREAEAGKKFKVKIPKFGLSLPKAGEGALGQEAEAKAKRPAFALGRPKGRGAEGSSGLLEAEEAAEGKGVMGRFKLGLSRMKMSPEVNGELENGSSKMKLPKLGFSNGEGAEDALQNGADDGKGRLGKIRLPQVELSSPSTAAESDPELSLQLVRAEEASEGAGAFAALKFKPPKITFSGFRKRNGDPAPGALVSSGARTEMASLERGEAGLKGEKPPKFKFPKVALSPKSHGVLEITSTGQARAEGAPRGSQEGLRVQLPKVGFSEEAGGSPPRAAVEGKGEATAATV